MIADRTGLRASYPASWRWLRIARRIGGWLTDAEGNALFELALQRTPARGAVVVELGSWLGKSSVLLAAALARKLDAQLICVDPWGDDENARYQTEYYEPLISKMRLSLEETFRRNIRRCRLVEIVRPIKGYSFDAVRNWQQQIDFLFIDASHAYESVHRDLLLWSPFVKVGGVVALHDVSTNWPGPSRVMAEDLQPPYFGDMEQVDSLVWAVKKSSDDLPENPNVILTTIPKSDFDGQQREIARLGDELRLFTQRTETLSAKLRALELENASLRESWSWRITAPLRRALAIAMSLRRNSSGK
jgi:predicted O-methyltransferase YrrM